MPVIGGDINEAARRLLAGRPVAFATETVYGLGARAEDEKAVAAVYALKGRPRGHPCILHVADFAEAARWAEIPAAAKKLAAAFMPGPLSLVLPSPSGNTVAVRAPMHWQAQKLLNQTGALFAPSANRFGRLSPTTAAHAAAEFPDADLYVLDGGECEIGTESTIAGCVGGRLFVLRPGAVSGADIEKAAGMRLSPPPDIAAPGRLKTHYAPRKPLKITAPDSPDSPDSDSPEAAGAAVLSRRRPRRALCWREAPSCPREYSRRLYGLLRELDDTEAAAVWVELPPDLPEWAAPRDRILRAAGIPQNGGGGGI